MIYQIDVLTVEFYFCLLMFNVNILNLFLPFTTGVKTILFTVRSPKNTQLNAALHIILQDIKRASHYKRQDNSLGEIRRV